MSLFDMLKDKATELLGGAGDKVSELTGIELPGGEVADQVTESAAGLADTATEAGQGVVDAAGTIGETATGALGDVTDRFTRG